MLKAEKDYHKSQSPKVQADFFKMSGFRHLANSDSRYNIYHKGVRKQENIQVN